MMFKNIMIIDVSKIIELILIINIFFFFFFFLINIYILIKYLFMIFYYIHFQNKKENYFKYYLLINLFIDLFL